MFIYAVGGEHPYRPPCQEILRRLALGEVAGEASADLVQEFLHQRTRRTGDRASAAAQARRIFETCRLHDVERRDVPVALDLFAATPSLSARDAMFAAVALNRDISVILSPDRGFDDVAGLRRVDPSDHEAVAALAG